MARNDQRSVPGIIEGSMTINPEPDGSVSFRVIIGNDRKTDQCDLLELIISPEHVQDLYRVLAAQDAHGDGGTDQVPPFCCHVGFRRNTVTSVA